MTATEFLEGENTIGMTRLEELHALFKELHEEKHAAVGPVVPACANEFSPAPH